MAFPPFSIQHDWNQEEIYGMASHYIAIPLPDLNLNVS